VHSTKKLPTTKAGVDSAAQHPACEGDGGKISVEKTRPELAVNYPLAAAAARQ
jgi:hypothetical protein